MYVLVRPTTRLLRLALAILPILAILAIPAPVAAQSAVDPRDIALTPADLPPGFTVEPDRTVYDRLSDGSLWYRVRMSREPTRENLLDGPIFVQQMIVRVGEGIGAGDGLILVRDVLIQQGFRPTSQGPNDAGTVSLTTSVPIPNSDVDVTVYSIGFTKENFVIFTTWGGIEDLVDFPRLLTLAGVSSSKLDAALRR